MNNEERFEYLFDEAKDSLAEVERYFLDKKWNRVVRRSQEVVELSLKALFKLMNVEYPKLHNTAPSLEKVLKDKSIYVEQDTIDEIKRISDELSRKRGPAFYGEQIYGENDGEQARVGARRVLDFVEKLSQQLRKKDIPNSR